nr:MAG TPA: hypothetical protein [Caudoviricetes sp.]
MPPPRSLVQRLNKVIASLGKSLSAIRMSRYQTSLLWLSPLTASSLLCR